MNGEELYFGWTNRKHARMKISAGVGALIGGVAQGASSLLAGSSQAAAAKKAAEEGNNLISQYYGNAQGYLSPYANAGGTGLNAVQNMVSNPSTFSMANFYNDPGYQFTLNQGNQAIQRSAAAKGGLTSGATGKALSQYTTNLANQTYGDAYNRWLQTQNQQYNQAMGLANLGYGASSQQSNNAMNAGTSMANNLTSAITGGAAANASGYVGAGNAAQNSLANYYLQNALSNDPYAQLGKAVSAGSSSRASNPMGYAGSSLTDLYLQNQPYPTAPIIYNYGAK